MAGKTERLSFSMPAEVKAALETAAGSDNRTLASYVELALTEKLLKAGFLEGTLNSPRLPDNK